MAPPVHRWRNKVAVVTGASAGIGAAIVDNLAEKGIYVVGLAECIEELAKKHQYKAGKIYAFKCDITNEEEIIKAFKWVVDNIGPVSILINNAEIVQQTSLSEGDTKKWKETLDTNILGLCVATREAFKIMKSNKINGHIIHINSIEGHYVPPIPDLNVYPATKHAVTALTETLRQEFKQQGYKIKVTSISPGAVSTEIQQANNFVMDESFKNMPYLKAEDIADSVWFAINTPPHVQVHELTIKPIGEKF